MSANLRISATMANREGDRQNSQARQRVTTRLKFRENTIASSNYVQLRGMKYNYLRNLGLQSQGEKNHRLYMNGVQPNSDKNWIENPQFYANSLELATRFIPAQVNDTVTYERAIAEFMGELEKMVQKRVLNRDFVISNSEKSDIDKRGTYFAMARSVLQLNSENMGNISTLPMLTQRMRAFEDNFWSGEKYKSKWSPDFRALIDDTIRVLLTTFSTAPSHFGVLIPRLQQHTPANYRGTPTRRLPKGFIYKMEQNPLFLRVIFNIMMLRFPCGISTDTHSWRTVTIPMYLERNIQEIGEHVEDTAYLTAVNFDYTDTSLQNLFYYIPEQERVIGIWPNLVRASNGPHQRTSIRVNYNCQMVRTILCKVRLQDQDAGSKVNFNMLFENEKNNFYTFIRKTDMFKFGPLIDPWARYYVSMTLFSSSSDKLLHIPWTIESLYSPFASSGGTAYDYSELLRVIQEVLERKISGRTDEEDDGSMIYISLQFISEFSKEYYQSLLHLVDQDDDEGDGYERKVNHSRHAPQQVSDDEEETVRNVRRRVSRTPQHVSKTAPTPLSGMLIGAPYAGTDKEKHFLTASMMNRFTHSDALFETPQRPTTYSCFMMAVIRCQMYMYSFEGGKCVNILATNSGKNETTCEGKLVQAVMDYSQIPRVYPFLKNVDGELFLQLFNNTKYTDGGKYLPGARDEQEIQYWEMAADEIWLHLERSQEREINYNDLGDYGQAFADFFNVCISIYDIEYRGNRICVITPHQKSPLELAQEGELLMIHIVFDQGHIHPVNNLRSFIRSKNRKSDIRINHYCPVCDKKQTDVLISSKESSMRHISECTKELLSFTSGFKDEQKYQHQTQIAQTKLVYQRTRGKLCKHWECSQCHHEVTQLSYQCHVCTIQPKKLEPLLEQKIYVWDVEAAQLEDQFNLLKHECNCIYIRRVYTDDPILQQGRYFPSEVEFVNALLDEEEFQNSIFIAHNSGSYDIHFLLRIFERTEIDHTYTPSPTSKHKFIMVQMTDRNVKFLDFIRFMPGSLKNIAESFKVPVSKGEFPHRFNNGQHDAYEGCIPPLNTPEDYWNLKEVRSKKQKDDFLLWYNLQIEQYCTCEELCHCEKKKWNFQEEIRKYCLMDVIVLAAVVKAYRDKIISYKSEENVTFPDSSVGWKVPSIDPFQFMTLPQLTMQTLIHGYQSNSFHNQGFEGIVSYFPAERASRCPEALLWLRRRGVLDNAYILSRENALREFYDFELKMSFDGYDYANDTVYFFAKCSYWGCPRCMREQYEDNLIIPDRGLHAKDVEDQYQIMMTHLNSMYHKVVSIWQHDFNASFFDMYHLRCIDLMKPLDCFYGGRTEVFKLYCNSEKFPDDEIHYYDVTSLYPSVYAHFVLPVGNPAFIIGYDADISRLNAAHPDRYFGYVRIKIRPPNTDRIGLLPQRDKQTQRLTFPVHPMEGCWFTEEVYLAVENGYVIEQLYEVYHWAGVQRSDQYLRGYVGFFLQMKQESEGWKKLGASCDDPTPEEQERIADQLYVLNGNLARIRPEKVTIDPVMRSLAKLFLNSLWGKWAQKQSKNCHSTIYGQQQLSALMSDNTIEKESLMFRNISPGVFKANYKKKNSFVAPVAHGNVFLAAAVTAWARITLHRQMLKIGADRLIYCDTDSIIFRWPKNGQNLSGIGLGKWTDEYPKNRIIRVYALAPKLYALTLGPKNVTMDRDLLEQGCYESFRAKGIQMTLENQSRLGFAQILPLLKQTMEDKDKGKEHTIEVNNFNIFTNSTNNVLPFGNLFSRYNTKKVRVIITKRTVEEVESCDFDQLAEINTFPPGYLE